MINPKLMKLWKITAANLENARKSLPEPHPSNAEKYRQLLDQYQICIKNNELESVLDILEELGEIVPCKGGFWRDLERAAEMMKLNDRIPYYKKKFKDAINNIKI